MHESVINLILSVRWSTDMEVEIVGREGVIIEVHYVAFEF